MWCRKPCGARNETTWRASLTDSVAPRATAEPTRQSVCPMRAKCYDPRQPCLASWMFTARMGAAL
jgi:hypothetical protein